MNLDTKNMIDELKSRGYRRQTIATAIGVSQETICRWASLKRSPKKEAFEKLCYFYKTTRPIYEPGIFGGNYEKS